MTDMSDERLEEYYRGAETWAHDRQQAADRSLRLAWLAAGIAATVAVLEAFALIALIPLKREVPYTLLVDRQTGYVEALRPLETDTISADAALTRSFLVQYVIARESFDIDTLQSNYRKVGLWSGGEARQRYLAAMNAGNSLSPLANLPRGASLDVQIRSVSSLSANTSLVRFSTLATGTSGQGQVTQHWQAVLTYHFSQAEMSAEDRLTNPLGFQVTRYRRDPETLPEQAVEDPAPQPPIPSTVSSSPAQSAPTLRIQRREQ
jgi:type IV secretion system protein VirB8